MTNHDQAMQALAKRMQEPERKYGWAAIYDYWKQAIAERHLTKDEQQTMHEALRRSGRVRVPAQSRKVK